MLLYYVFFLFVAFISKLLLALVMIYLLLPADRRCDDCDEETLLIEPGPGVRLISWLAFGSVQRRWCPRCNWYGLARCPGSVGQARPGGPRIDRSRAHRS